MFPEPIQKFIEIFSKLPSMGPRQASRLSFHFLRKKELAKNVLSSLNSLLNEISICQNCFLPFEKNSSSFCSICQDKKRNQNIICIVEKELDVFSLEKTNRFKGVYHILGNLIDPSHQETYNSLKLEILEKRIKQLPDKIAEEIIIAVNPTTQGDLTSMYLERRLKNLAKKISRLARGLPSGGEIEFADQETLSNSFENRR
jgi:recombination protein RecR